MRPWKLFVLGLICAVLGAIFAHFARDASWCIYVAFCLTGAGGMLAVAAGIRSEV